MAGARSLWRANGMKEQQFGKPIIAVVNSFTQMVPGHAHLHEIGQMVKKIIEKQGCFAPEFSTIAVDDGIAMGHDGMLYSLPSRDLIADSVEYMCNAHQVDAMICISNCDKITPGMLMASMRLNIPTVFVSGGPMEAGKFNGKAIDLVDSMVVAADENTTDEDVSAIEKNACPTCGSCSGMFTANSMNCLTEALGLSLPGNGTIVATHVNRKKLFEDAANQIVKNTFKYYRDEDETVLPRAIGSRASFLNAMTLDVAMGGSSNTILHLLAIASEAKVDFTMKDVDELSKRIPVLCKVAPSSNYHVEDVNRAGGVMRILAELNEHDLLDTSVSHVSFPSMKQALLEMNVRSVHHGAEAQLIYKSAPAGIPNLVMGSQQNYYRALDLDDVNGCVRSVENAFSADGGLAVLYGNLAVDGCVVKTAGVHEDGLVFNGIARVFESQDAACDGILGGEVEAGDVVVIRYEGPKGGPGMQEMLYPTSYLKSRQLDKVCALLTDGRFSGGTSGLSIGHASPEAAAGGLIALVENGDPIEINIPERSIHLNVSKEELELRKTELLEKNNGSFLPGKRERKVSQALKMYAAHVSSADKGAIRVL